MLIARIHNRYNDLTDAEQKVAAFILSDPQQIPNLTVHALAQQCSVAPSAVIRFCKSLDLTGFSQLKITLAMELTAQKEPQMPALRAEDDTETVFRKVFRSGVQTLQDTIAMMDMDRAGKMVDALAGARRICIFGVGTSSVIATDAQYRFSQLGLNASACTDILFMNVTAVNLGKGDAVLCISHSGRTKAVVDALRHAKAAGAVTLAITSFSDSLLYRESDVALSVYADEINYPVEAVSARVAHICLIDSLMMALAARKFDDFAGHVSARNNILREIRYEQKGNYDGK